MEIRNDKGITGVDITIAVIILTIFITLITNMFYNVNMIGTSINRKSEATYIAIQVIEATKQINYDKLPSGETEEETELAIEELNTLLEDANKINLKNGYSVEIKVENYRKIKQDTTLEDIIKRITVTVKYNEKAKEKNVEISTVVVK